MKNLLGVHAQPRDRRGNPKDLRQISVIQLFQRYFLKKTSPSPCFVLGKRIFDRLGVLEEAIKKDVWVYSINVLAHTSREAHEIIQSRKKYSIQITDSANRGRQLFFEVVLMNLEMVNMVKIRQSAIKLFCEFTEDDIELLQSVLDALETD